MFTLDSLLQTYLTLASLLSRSAKTVLNLRDKKQKEIAIYVFIVMMIFTIFAVGKFTSLFHLSVRTSLVLTATLHPRLGSIFTASLIYSLDIVRVSFDEVRRGVIACYVDAAGSCSNCNCSLAEVEQDTCVSSEPQCPEWTSQDVSKIIQTQLKQSATLAAIFFIYAFSALRFGFGLRYSQAQYQIAYV